MKECLISVELALSLRKLADSLGLKVPMGNLGLKCPECKMPVKPFEDGMQGPHFEHLAGNEKCSLSDS